MLLPVNVPLPVDRHNLIPKIFFATQDIHNADLNDREKSRVQQEHLLVTTLHGNSGHLESNLLRPSTEYTHVNLSTFVVYTGYKNTCTCNEEIVAKVRLVKPT
jgi:hypothetical protein